MPKYCSVFQISHLRGLFILLLFPCGLSAQDFVKIDSLKKVLKTTLSDKQKVDTYNRLAYHHLRTDSAKVMKYIQEAMKLAQKIDYQEAIIDTYYYQGFMQLKQSNPENSVKLFEKVKVMATQINYQKGVSNFHYGMARLLANQDKYEEARITYEKALKIRQEINDEEGTADVYDRIGWLYWLEGNLSEAATYYLKAIKINQRINKSIFGLDMNYMNLGTVYTVKANFAKGLEYYTKALEINNPSLLPTLYNNMGLLYSNQSNYVKALDYFFRALKINEAQGNLSNVAQNHGNIGLSYANQEEYDKALTYYFKALKLYEEINISSGIALVAHNIGLVYVDLKVYEKALKYFNQALKIDAQIGDQVGIMYDYKELGYLYREQQKYDLSEDYLQKALQTTQQLEMPHERAQIYVGLGELRLKQKQYQQSVQFLKQSMDIAQEIGTPDIMLGALEVLHQTQEALGNSAQAYQTHLEYIKMKDSLNNEKNTKKIARLEANYEFEKEKDSLQFAQEKERFFFEQETERQKTMQQATFVGLGLVSILLIISVVFFLDKRKSNQQLTNTNIELNTANEEIQTAQEELQVLNESLNNTLKVSEKQRKKIQDSINYAQRIQEAMLPSKQRLNTALPEHFIFFRPKDVVSGDFYWLGEVSDKVIITAIDCTGHGVPGAFMSMVGNDLLTYVVQEKHLTDSDKILKQLHLEVRRVLNQQETKNQDGMDMALVVWDKKNNLLQFSGAKNPLVYIQNEELHQIKGDKIPIGGEQREAERIFTRHEIPLTSPITFYVFSDGFQDQFGGEKKQKFMIKRLRQLLFDLHELPMPTQNEKLGNILDDWMTDTRQIDDVLIVGAKVG